MERVNSFYPSFLTVSFRSHLLRCLSSILSLFFLTVHLLPTPPTVVLNSTVLHKSPLSLAACCGRFYNPLLRQWRGLFHHLRRLQCCRETERPLSIWESSRWLWGRKPLSLSVFSHASLAVSFHCTSFPFSLQKNCISLFAFFVLPPSGWVSFVIFLTFSYFSLTEWRASRCTKCRTVQQQQLKANPLFFSLLFMWQRPDLLKAGALTKKGTNDRERCQSNTQAFQRCKHMYACTKGRSGSLFRAST